MERQDYRPLLDDATTLAGRLRGLAERLTEEADRLEGGTTNGHALLYKDTTDEELGVILDLLVLPPDRYDHGRAILEIAELAGKVRGRRDELAKRYRREVAD